MSDDFRQSGGSPWGTPPGGGSGGNGSGRGPTPPDVDKIIKEFQEKLKVNSRINLNIDGFENNENLNYYENLFFSSKFNNICIKHKIN